MYCYICGSYLGGSTGQHRKPEKGEFGIPVNRLEDVQGIWDHIESVSMYYHENGTIGSSTRDEANSIDVIADFGKAAKKELCRGWP